MKSRSLENIGVPPALVPLAKLVVSAAREAGVEHKEVRSLLQAVLADPASHVADPHFGRLAAACVAAASPVADHALAARSTQARWRQWGQDIDDKAVEQMQQAAKLPVAVAAALMPDAHVGYGLPIGGVLATDNAVVPYAVGVDIACRMKLSVLDLPVDWLDSRRDRLTAAIEQETRFGIGSEFGQRGQRDRGQHREHEVLDEDWSVSPVTQANRDKARRQLGTSGSGNHFVEFGTLTVDPAQAAALGLGRDAARAPRPREPGCWESFRDRWLLRGSSSVAEASMLRSIRRATERGGG
jgi:tRNA-splicing ligase RtcB